MYQQLITSVRIFSRIPEDLREASERDRSHIVQAAPVRRLQQKTQVFPLDVKASVRSRLTHSLEVQACGRQIARQILAKLPSEQGQESIWLNMVEMACLLHDVGNPPFGHFGEQVISHWLAEQLDGLYHQSLARPASKQWSILRTDLVQFDGNAQSLRLVHSLHELDLTITLLAALCKYPNAQVLNNDLPLVGGWRHKRGVFFSEQPVYQRISEQLGLLPHCRHPWVYIMEAADDISYCIADLEDAIDRKVLTLLELEQALLDADGSAFMRTLLSQSRASERGFFAHFRQKLTDQLVAHAADNYITWHRAILRGEYPYSLLHGESQAASTLEVLRAVAREKVFLRPEVEALELTGYGALRGVLNHYALLLAMPATDFAKLLAEQSDGTLSLARRLFHRLSARHLKAYRRTIASPDPRFFDSQEQEWYYRVRLLLDYVSGMTDTYMLEEYRLLSSYAL